jgi:hypothetical protein
LTLNVPKPEYINKSLDIYFEAINAINEWTSFETNFVRKPAIQEEIVRLEEGLPELHINALHLIFKVQHAWCRVQSDLRTERSKAKGKC